MDLILTLFTILSAKVLENLVLCLTAAGCAFIFIVADTVAGLYYNISMDGAEFDWRKFITPIIKLVIVLVVVVIMSTGLTVVGNFINYLGWSEAELFLNYLSNLGIITTFIFVAAKRGMNAFEKLLKITGVSIEELQDFINNHTFKLAHEVENINHEMAEGALNEPEVVEDSEEILG